eukprot:Nitzschia sp. Nitz4//scaffold152_size53828//534//3528//NITZ4_006734-RA/size53828-augustus-gene-0.95-mRNA-1//-1//CDS//3329537178//6011//frame0
MAGPVETQSTQRKSAWELRVRLNRERWDQQRSASQNDLAPKSPLSSKSERGVARSEAAEAPTVALRSIVAGQKIRRSGGIRPHLNRDKCLPSQRELLLKEKEDSTLRRSMLVDSLQFFDLPTSFSERQAPSRGNSAILKQNPYAAKKEEEELQRSEHSLESIPPPEREKRSPSLHRLSFHRSTSSFNASLDLSDSRVFEYDGELEEHTPIITAASDEQWARFKLLGRIGLGNICLSREAQKLVDSSFDIMLRAIKQILATREERSDSASVESMDVDNVLYIRTGNLMAEVQETIPVSERGPAKLCRDPSTVVIDQVVQEQLRDYITVISSMYRDNSFHDFEHASTVLKAVDKLIHLVDIPQEPVDCHDLRYSCGLATEPWNHFALVFSALVHDVDHHGVPNAQLIKEGSHVADAYRNKSVAEQNSIELAWNLLMESCYKELRNSIFQYRTEIYNFRSLVVTAVLATDIADKELAAFRKGRAAEALNLESDDEGSTRAGLDLVSRKATYVVETLIQVADVSHTMGNFNAYKKWNHRLYKEMYNAYKNGRAESDPTDTWFRGEFGFYDFYLIPLAKKLKSCGIKSEACEEYVKNASRNRKIWSKEGEKILESYVAERKAEEEAAAKVVSLKQMTHNDSSSDENDSEADDIDDSISISECDSVLSSLDIPPEPFSPPHISEKIPSKASTEMDGAPVRIVRRSKYSESAELEKRQAEQRAARRSSGVSDTSEPSPAFKNTNLKLRSRSRSPTSESDRSGMRTLLNAGLKLRARSRSPGSESERSAGRSILELRSRSRSPGSGSERSDPRMTIRMARCDSPGSVASDQSGKKKKIRVKVKKRLGRKDRSVSPTSENEDGKATKVVRRGRRPSRSRSPAATSASEVSEHNGEEPSKVKRRARKPSRSKSPASCADQATDKKTKKKPSKKTLKKGKRPSRSQSPHTEAAAAAATSSGDEDKKEEAPVVRKTKRSSKTKD